MDTTTANGRNGHKPQPVVNKTAVSAPAQPTANGNGRANAQTAVGLVDFVYGDGTAVDQSNRTAVETFQRYLAAKQTAPASKEALLVYYRERVGWKALRLDYKKRLKVCGRVVFKFHRGL